MSEVRIGPHALPGNLILAPMAGVTDRPYRQLCLRFGASLTVAEMVTSDTRLWNSPKSRQRLLPTDDHSLRAVQIAGADPLLLADAAKSHVERGAQIIDINMGCPAKKVCNKAAGSALMKDERLVAAIFEAVVQAVEVPVTVKMRSGWDPAHRNAPRIAKIAEQSGIQAVAVHGRTRTDLYRGQAEYETIAQVKQNVTIPVFANGDIDSPEKARQVLDFTRADGLLIGRGAQGKPWIFRQIQHYLTTGERLSAPSLPEMESLVLEHLHALHCFYGEYLGIRIARKHVSWYLADLPESKTFRQHFNRLGDCRAQQTAIELYFQQCRIHQTRMVA